MNKKVTVNTLQAMKQEGEKIVSLTAYDYSFAATLDAAGVDLVMVGDSLGMVMQGFDSTLPVTLEDMIYHSACVARGCERAMIVTDLPFLSYQISPEQAMESAGLLLKEGDAHMVKLEGGEPMAETIAFISERGVPVCAHLGLTPQSIHKLGGYKVQGKDEDSAAELMADAILLEEAGASLLVLEAVPQTLAAEVTQALTIPTIGIGAGPDCDGQVLVLQDMLGLYPRPSPKFSRNFMQDADSIAGAVKAYVDAVKNKQFPAAEHSF
jgi:3-methyl-2-oxobutanoate hydroxymethyltransferase